MFIAFVCRFCQLSSFHFHFKASSSEQLKIVVSSELTLISKLSFSNQLFLPCKALQFLGEICLAKHYSARLPFVNVPNGSFQI